MKKQCFIFSLLILGIIACSAPQNKSEIQSESSHEWELQILDSIQVDYLGDISTGDFRGGIGLLYDYTANTLVKIDYEGQVLATHTYPKDGPNSISYVSTVKLHPGGNPYIGHYRGPYLELNEDLSVKRNIELPFPSQSFGGLMDEKSFEFWQENIIFHFPGRDEVSPYTETYLSENFLLEKLNPTTGESSPLIRTPSTSKFSSGLLYERPAISFTLSGDDLLLYFNNEPKIHRFNLLDSGKHTETLDINPTKFIEAPELKDKTENYGYEKLVEGNIFGVFADQKYVVVHYSEGISEEVFTANQFNFPEDFPKLIALNQSNFKVYDEEKGWSNEILIPKKVDKIFAMEDPTQAFFALRNDEYLGEEQDYLTFYKLKLVQK
ncbi:hypothetical protein PBT90_14770 [Algoriphagus halophytocola]|uniref:Phytase-like domain-containing protein n=1 Tax=Algoriphagus halophytocola TaxID=2991499 RepID=A0ABY6MLK5_9BACT|nr:MULTISPECIES: hypothetical protein [unclassified Algoriphagus]UZD24642.1 hypothetical protein OM944_09105 [Algoriphagus sp. TR-M5]WBL42010.1 hypothetical protein PBT90_14770 [Algoriphagus sp. TR-M9]